MVVVKVAEGRVRQQQQQRGWRGEHKEDVVMAQASAAWLTNGSRLSLVDLCC